MSKRLFIATPVPSASDNWLICSAGVEMTGVEWFVTTHNVNASDLNLYSGGAKADAELIARLLNWYYKSMEAEFVLQKAEE